MRTLSTILLLTLALSLLRCTGRPGPESSEKDSRTTEAVQVGDSTNDRSRHIQSGDANDMISIQYAERFAISYHNGYKKVRVNNPWPGSTDTLTYLVTDDQSRIPDDELRGDNQLILQPVNEVVCFSTTHLPYLELIGEENRLTGFPTTDYIYSRKIRDRVDGNLIKDLGPSNEINFESLLGLDPDLVIAFSMGSDLSMFQKIQLAGIPLVFNADYLEAHPLGRAEWIKFISAFFNREETADSIFREVEKAYLDTKLKMEGLPLRPSVFTGVVYGDTWFMPGGKHYGTVFFRDAGGDYVWADNESENILQLSFESVYEQAGEADFWIGTATYNSLAEIEQADARYAGFKAFRTGNVYNYSLKSIPDGGNAYFELGYARPDIILKDLAKILHPREMEDHTFYFYKKLY